MLAQLILHIHMYIKNKSLYSNLCIVFFYYVHCLFLLCIVYLYNVLSIFKIVCILYGVY